MTPEDISNIAWLIWMTVLAGFGLFGYIQLKKIIEWNNAFEEDE